MRGVALPAYVGKMIYVRNWAAAPAAHDGADGGAGRLDLAPEFLLDAGELRHAPYAGARVVFRDISNSTNERSFVSALVPAWYPCGNLLPVIDPSAVGPSGRIEIAAHLSSIPFDWATCQRKSGTHINWHIAESLALPPPKSHPEALIRQYARLALSDIHFAPDWLRFGTGATTQTVARTPHERIRVTAMVDAAIAAIMGLSISDLRHILAECDLPNGAPPAHPKGFWRVDKDKLPRTTPDRADAPRLRRPASTRRWRHAAWLDHLPHRTGRRLAPARDHSPSRPRPRPRRPRPAPPTRRQPPRSPLLRLAAGPKGR